MNPKTSFALRVLSLALVVTAGLAGLAAAADGVVNINTAGVDELMRLPRVGPTVAARIVEFREQNGRFESAEDLLLVQGIGDRTFELLEPYVTVDGETTLEEKVRSSRGDEEQQGDGGR